MHIYSTQKFIDVTRVRAAVHVNIARQARAAVASQSIAVAFFDLLLFKLLVPVVLYNAENTAFHFDLVGYFVL